ncbi:formate dehydrogenase [Mycolicibacterium aromaticivorans JS19b1 = JCM 16368]|uniref:Formate dehydrogenase n=1 Tax=Mycolicibacterium aromaticivorans JS19b1 = JCM 16368 TaxID=1440774 RepID=A0A064CRL7_9MYCO|nr:molybdopterin-dependent oxidoreductase [Mycolicibacterium aromaticivorans]KDF01339.1 formate dehydrogenase [Mycolicibacterium aromaticivorans JS19b1 = JCM 16368]
MFEVTPTPPQTVHTFCRYCLASCGVEVTVEAGRVVKISADKQNPHSWADFCAKGRTAAQLVEHPRRITRPMRRVGDGYVEATWEDAVADISVRMSAIISAGGPDAVATYTGNPSGFSSSNLLFMTGWLDAIGSQNRYYVGSVDQNALHVVAQAMYGSQLFVPVSDIDNCDFFLLVGANPAVSAWNWVETVPGGWKRALARQRQGARIVVVDPVRTESAEKADTHLAVRPGQDWALLLAMVKVILDDGLEHRDDCRDLAMGMAALRALAADADLDDLATRCGIPRAEIETLARDFAAAPGAMAITRTGVSLHVSGTIGEWLGHVLNVITGRMDRPGGRRFERGYVDALKLAAFAKPVDHLSRVQGRPMVAGHHGLDELPGEITTSGAGQIRAMVINAGNPVISGPDGARLDAALEQLDLLVVIDFLQRESHRHAHWLLPAAHWLERDDLLALTSGLHDEPYVHYGRRAVDPPDDAREEWRLFLDLTLAMKRPFLGIRGVNGFVKATRALARVTRRPSLAFGPHWIDRMIIASSRGISWRAVMAHPHGWVFGKREFGHLRKALRTEDKKIRVAPAEFVARTHELLAEPHPVAPAERPFQLANSRRRHSMNSWLNDIDGLHPSGKDNHAVINPDDAAALGVADGDRVRVFSDIGSIELTAVLSDKPRPGVVIVDHGWGSRVFDPRGGAEPMSFGVNRNLLVDGSPVDPLSQTPALSSAFVGVERVRP